MTDFQSLLNVTKSELLKAIDHLEVSCNKIKAKKIGLASKNVEDLEVLEAMASRFARASDLFLSKYVRLSVMAGDPAFRGSLRDFLNQGEKLGLIEDANVWLAIRELRNKIANDYATAELKEIFAQIMSQTPHLISIRDKIK